MSTGENPTQTDLMFDRLTRLRSDVTARSEGQSPAVEETFEAFGVTLEELRVAEENLLETNQLLLTTRHTLDAERRRCHALFDHTPVPLLVTDPVGVVRDAN